MVQLFSNVSFFILSCACACDLVQEVDGWYCVDGSYFPGWHWSNFCEYLYRRTMIQRVYTLFTRPLFFYVLFQKLHSRDDWHFLSASSRINQCTKWLRHSWLLLRWLLLYRSPQFPYNPGQKYMVHLENVQCSRHRPCSMMKTAVFELYTGSFRNRLTQKRIRMQWA